MPQVKQGSTVLVHYTARLRNGEVVESTAGGDPLRVTVGGGKVMLGLEEALVGMGPGEPKLVTVPPEKAFGRKRTGATSTHSYDRHAHVGKSAALFQRQVVNQGEPGEFSIVNTDRGMRVEHNPHLAGEEVVLDIDLVSIES